ncbi:glycine zipper 2TM domain-containing protein [Sinimarinibacterium sp. CAU 1509]|uniref:glycine zipper 2TM domain-containing protein n=1 Tax=Sinimarinibacterium sp. CAU 1509 TaxID=2562283 RepID=UPI0010AB4F94|nr:glycine zipper 2TM domain-containing protein [Sinimarinibacterium sp. CAU 1509]TJY63198.1 glycine zipper 2TM domain-containing protein [Sinimarinibacterium sp. CAU 1509]
MLKSMKKVLPLTLLALMLGACAPDQSSTTETAATTEATPEPTAEPTPEPTPVPKPAPKPATQYRPQPTPVPTVAICYECGTVVAITEVKQAGEGSGAGAVAGAVAGGVAGHQFGKGKGKDAATAAGAILGAIAGHQVEKQVRANMTYDITVSMEDGTTRVVNVADASGVGVGAKVRVEGQNIYLR